MARIAFVTGLLAMGLAGSGCHPAPVEPPTPAIVPAPAAIAGREALRKAAEQVLSSTCGNSVFDPGYPEHYTMLEQAGPAVVPVLTEMVAEKDFSVHFVMCAALSVSKYPYSEPFREALRGRRDDPDFPHDHGARLVVFEYFASNGDETDLVWMEKTIDSLDESRRSSAAEPIGKLRRRLRK